MPLPGWSPHLLVILWSFYILVVECGVPYGEATASQHQHLPAQPPRGSGPSMRQEEAGGASSCWPGFLMWLWPLSSGRLSRKAGLWWLVWAWVWPQAWLDRWSGTCHYFLLFPLPGHLFQASSLERIGPLSSLSWLGFIKRAPEAFVNRASTLSGTLLVFCVNQGISASFSLLSYQLQTTSFQSIKGPQQWSTIMFLSK